MPKADRYSVSTRRLRKALAELGHDVSCSTLEAWARDGLAPRPVRQSMGRNGSTSEYPPGAVKQYDAVAGVMQRGRDVHTSVLMLIGRGGLPTSQTLFRRSLRYLCDTDQSDTADPLTAAERSYVDARNSRAFAPMISFVKKNAGEAAVVDRVTGKPVPIESIIESALVNSLAAMLGRQLPNGEATTELAAASGFLEPGISAEERVNRENYLEAFFEDVIELSALRDTAEIVTPNRLQLVIRDFLADPDLVRPLLDLPSGWGDVMVVMLGLAVARVDELGGTRWFEKAISGT